MVLLFADEGSQYALEAWEAFTAFLKRHTRDVEGRALFHHLFESAFHVHHEQWLDHLGEHPHHGHQFMERQSAQGNAGGYPHLWHQRVDGFGNVGERQARLVRSSD